jgi:hypothetical protein
VGYYIKSIPWKQSLPKWKVQFISFRKSDTVESKAKKPKREWDIKKERWGSLGFYELMTLEEAKARAKQLNADAFLKRQEARVKELEEKREAKQMLFESVLPQEFADEFELRFIQARVNRIEALKGKRNRAYVLWRAAQRLIVAIRIEPSEWFYHPEKIYDYLHQQKYSIRYASSVLKMANLWGFYFCKKMNRPFLPVLAPKGYERKRIIEASYEKSEKVRRASLPLAPQTLSKSRDKLNERNYNWLFISVWLGLRSQEVDNLKKTELWKIETLPNGREILWVFQTKIVALPAEERWKPIPIIFDEQKTAIEIIRRGDFSRPLSKTMAKHFGQGITTYAGRKGFVDLMLSKGQSLENISVWLGHSALNRTWHSYKQRRKFHLAGF